MNTSPRLSPFSTRSSSRSLPALPTKGTPCASSWNPGASPTNMRSASALPEPNTTWVRVSCSGQRVQACDSRNRATSSRSTLPRRAGHGADPRCALAPLAGRPIGKARIERGILMGVGRYPLGSGPNRTPSTDRYLPRTGLDPLAPKTEHNPLARVAVVGAGRLGTALAAALRAAGTHVEGPLGRHSRPSGADAVLLCVPDSEIPAAAGAVAGAAPLVGHTSGATPLDALDPSGAQAFGLHPLQTFAGGEGAERFRGAGCAVAGRTGAGPRRRHRPRRARWACARCPSRTASAPPTTPPPPSPPTSS